MVCYCFVVAITATAAVAVAACLDVQCVKYELNSILFIGVALIITKHKQNDDPTECVLEFCLKFIWPTM